MAATAGIAGAQDRPAEPTEAVSLERIRQGIADATTLQDTGLRGYKEGRPVFRLRVENVQTYDGLAIWYPGIDSPAPGYVRPRHPSVHYEFLRMVTPEEFRSGTLYPIGVDLFSVIRKLSAELRDASRRRAEKEERQRIREELEALKKQLGIP